MTSTQSHKRDRARRRRQPHGDDLVRQNSYQRQSRGFSERHKRGDHPAFDRAYAARHRQDVERIAVTLPAVDDPAEAVELVREADRLCPYSNATRGNIAVAVVRERVVVA